MTCSRNYVQTEESAEIAERLYQKSRLLSLFFIPSDSDQDRDQVESLIRHQPKARPGKRQRRTIIHTKRRTAKGFCAES
jgi:hypothetical protein